MEGGGRHFVANVPARHVHCELFAGVAVRRRRSDAILACGRVVLDTRAPAHAHAHAHTHAHTHTHTQCQTRRQRQTVKPTQSDTHLHRLGFLLPADVCDPLIMGVMSATRWVRGDPKAQLASRRLLSRLG